MLAARLGDYTTRTRSRHARAHAGLCLGHLSVLPAVLPAQCMIGRCRALPVHWGQIRPAAGQDVSDIWTHLTPVVLKLLLVRQLSQSHNCIRFGGTEEKGLSLAA